MAQPQGPRWEVVDAIPAFPHDHIIADTATDAMKCCISLNVMEDPSVVLPCGHSFDYTQINRYLKGKRGRKRICPKCRGRVTGVQRVPGFQTAIRETVQTRCVVEGCGEMMKVDELEAHINNQCQHTRFRCLQPDVNGGPCGHITTRDLQSIHHDSECPNRLVVCQYCGNQVIASNRDNHEEGCDERMVECRCMQQYRQGDRAQHRGVCGEEQIRCPICKDLMKRRQLEAHNKDPEVVPRHMMALFQEVQEVRNENHKMGQENQRLRARVRTLEEDHVNNLVRALGLVDRVEESLDMDDPLVVAINKLAGKEGWRVMVGGDEEEKPGTVKVLVGLIKYIVERVKEIDGDEGSCHYHVVVAAALKGAHGLIKGTGDLTRAAAASFLSQGAQEVVVGAMRSCPTNYDVQLYGCDMTGDLVYYDEEDGRAMIAAGVCPIVVESMRAFSSDPDFQRWALLTVKNLAYSAEGNRVMGEAGGCDVVMEALDRFPQVEGVVRHGYGAAGMLCRDSEEHMRALCMRGVCEKVVAAMRSFPDDLILQDYCCHAIKCLAGGNQERGRRLVEAGAREAVQSALERFHGDEDIQQDGGDALEALPA